MAKRFVLADYLYAHRGLWTGHEAPENTHAAFDAAAKHGLGMEFDIRPASGGDPVIHHDETLERMASRPDRVEDQSIDVLRNVQIAGAYKLPSFGSLLASWRHDLPLLTEMKIDGQTDPQEFGRKTGEMLQTYPGLAAAMSFSEQAVRALPKDVMRGQLIGPSHKIGRERFNEILERALADHIDYVAINITDVDGIRADVPDDYPIVCWTVRTLDEVRIAVHENVAIIFEHLDPALVSAYALP